MVQDLHSCSSAESGNCIFQLIAKEEVCYPQNKPDEICNALDRVYSFMLYTRQAFCQRPDSRSGCSWWKELLCTVGVLAAEIGCAVVSVATGESTLLPCIKGVMGAASRCVPCICSIVHGYAEDLCEDLLPLVG